MSKTNLITRKAAMDRLHMEDERTIKRIIDSGELPHRKISGRILIAEEDLETYIDSCRMVGVKSEPTRGIKSGGVNGSPKLIAALTAAESALRELREALNQNGKARNE